MTRSERSPSGPTSGPSTNVCRVGGRARPAVVEEGIPIGRRSGGPHGGAGAASRDHERRGQPPASDRAPKLGLGGHLAAGADRAALGAGHEPAEDQRAGLHRPGHGPRRDPQLQPRRLRFALPALFGRQAADLHAARAPQDQEDRPLGAHRPGPAVCDLEPGEARRLPGRRGGGDRHLPRGPEEAPARGGRQLSSGEDLEALERPPLRAEEEPHPRALRAGRGRQGDRDLPG